MVIVCTCAAVRRSCRSLMAFSYCCWEMCPSWVVMSIGCGRSYCLEAFSVYRCAVDTSVWAKIHIVNIKALFHAFGGARRTFVLFLGCRLRGKLCRGMLGFFFKSA